MFRDKPLDLFADQRVRAFAISTRVIRGFRLSIGGLSSHIPLYYVNVTITSRLCYNPIRQAVQWLLLATTVRVQIKTAQAMRGREIPRSVAPVFVVSCPRSGTTLLYHMLLSAGDFAVYRKPNRPQPGPNDHPPGSSQDHTSSPLSKQGW